MCLCNRQYGISSRLIFFHLLSHLDNVIVNYLLSLCIGKLVVVDK